MIIGVITLLVSQLIANAYSGGLASIMTVPQYVKKMINSFPSRQFANTKMIFILKNPIKI